MQIQGTSGVQSATQINVTHKAQATGSQAVATPYDTTDQIDISSEARMLSGMNDTSIIRSERIAEIRQQIEAGQYETVEKLDVAMERMLDRLA